jgi:asparagine synthase (glutamine-hydrolysing)
MCGIFVAWDPQGVQDASFDEVLAKLRHRGPDAQSSVLRDSFRLYLGHARLKIIDVSDSANQPLVSPCGRWALVFNGEIYNYRQIHDEIGDRWQWRTRSDTEVLLAAWALWGEGCLHRVVGMFALVMHDSQMQTLTIARDRFGIKPLYYVTEGTKRLFASEIPPLLSFLTQVIEDKAAIRTYLQQGLYDHGEHTFFKGVRSLAPGSLIEINLNNGHERRHRWYRLADHVTDLRAISREELLEEVERLVMQSVSSHLVADVAVGLNVSGGVDSSMLVRCTMAELGHAHLFTQDYIGYSELPWVTKVSDGGVLHVSELDLHQISGYLDDTVRSQAEPFGGVFVCGYNALYDSARAHGITVLLDGNGVDESFLGYKRYHQIYVADTSDESVRHSRAQMFEAYWGHPPKPVLLGASIDGTNGLRPEALSASLRSSELLELSQSAEFSDPVRQAAAEDLLYSKIPRGLRFNDRVSMAHSCELRVPYLDHRLVEVAFGIPTSMLLNKKGSKALFRDVLARRAPASVAYAKKRSVQSPQREWLAEGWRSLVESVLDSERFADRGWVNPDMAKKEYRTYLDGARENSFFIWQWLNLELWARKFLDDQQPR